MRPSVSGRAEADLANQYRWYCDNADDRVAEKFLAAFDATVKRLEEFPELGRLRRFRDPGLTGLRSVGVTRPYGGHLIFYRSGAEGVSIERVMHGTRDLPRRLVEPPEGYPPG